MFQKYIPEYLYILYEHPTWSNGQDTWLSPRRPGFNSRRGRNTFFRSFQLDHFHNQLAINNHPATPIFGPGNPCQKVMHRSTNGVDVTLKILHFMHFQCVHCKRVPFGRPRKRCQTLMKHNLSHYDLFPFHQCQICFRKSASTDLSDVYVPE